MGVEVSEVFTRSLSPRRAGQKQTIDYSGFARGTAMKRCGKLIPVKLGEGPGTVDRRRSAAGKRAHDHQFGARIRRAGEISRQLAVDEHLDVRTDRALLVDNPKPEAGIAAIELASASPSAGLALGSSTSTVSAPSVYERSSPGIRTRIRADRQQTSTA